MARVKGGTVHAARRKKILKQAKGYFGSKHKLYRTAKEQVMHSLQYAYRDRRQIKRNMRKLWITRINAACRMNDISYSKFINGLSKAGIEINRKMLSEIAINDEDSFTKLVVAARKGLENQVAKTEKSETEVKPVAKKETKEIEAKEETDLNSKTVAELREMAAKAEVVGYSTMKKADLIAALK